MKSPYDKNPTDIDILRARGRWMDQKVHWNGGEGVVRDVRRADEVSPTAPSVDENIVARIQQHPRYIDRKMVRQPDIVLPLTVLHFTPECRVVGETPHVAASPFLYGAPGALRAGAAPEVLKPSWSMSYSEVIATSQLTLPIKLPPGVAVPADAKIEVAVSAKGERTYTTITARPHKKRKKDFPMSLDINDGEEPQAPADAVNDQPAERPRFFEQEVRSDGQSKPFDDQVTSAREIVLSVKGVDDGEMLNSMVTQRFDKAHNDPTVSGIFIEADDTARSIEISVERKPRAAEEVVMRMRMEVDHESFDSAMRAASALAAASDPTSPEHDEEAEHADALEALMSKLFSAPDANPTPLSNETIQELLDAQTGDAVEIHVHAAPPALVEQLWSLGEGNPELMQALLIVEAEIDKMGRSSFTLVIPKAFAAEVLTVMQGANPKTIIGGTIEDEEERDSHFASAILSIGFHSLLTTLAAYEPTTVKTLAAVISGVRASLIKTFLDELIRIGLVQETQIGEEVTGTQYRLTPRGAIVNSFGHLLARDPERAGYTVGEIADETEVAPAQVEKNLPRLIKLGIIERLRGAGEAHYSLTR